MYSIVRWALVFVISGVLALGCSGDDTDGTGGRQGLLAPAEQVVRRAQAALPAQAVTPARAVTPEQEATREQVESAAPQASEVPPGTRAWAETAALSLAASETLHRATATTMESAIPMTSVQTKTI